MTLEKNCSEQRLLESWKAGDRRAGDALLRLHEAVIYRFFRNKISTDPQDLVQETLTAANASCAKFDGCTSFKCYLLSIARHRLYEYYRKKKLDQRFFEFDTVSVFDMGPSPSALVARQSEKRMLLEALRRIPVNSQIVLELHYWEDMTGPEIAEVIGTPLDTVYSRLRNAKEQLRKKLEAVAGLRVLPESTLDRLEEWALSIRPQALPVETPSKSGERPPSGLFH